LKELEGERTAPSGEEAPREGESSRRSKRSLAERRRTRDRADEADQADQAENEEPQPQVLLTFGLPNLKPEPWRPST
jgi:hypothetical protein